MSIHLELITPERLAFKEEVDFIAAPAADGEIGILPHHAPLLTKLGPGELRFRHGNEIQIVALTGGFLEVQSGSRVSIFAETAEFAKDIDVERAKIAAERAQSKLAAAHDLTGSELAEVESALTRALLRLKIAETTKWRKLPPEMPVAGNH